MKYITSIHFPSSDELASYMNCHSYKDWPQKVFLDRGLNNLLFQDITIFYGGNGSGKSTILDCISEKLGATRKKPIYIEKKYFPNIPTESYYPFKDYLKSIFVSFDTNPETNHPYEIPRNTRLITSDDVFTKISNAIKNNSVSDAEATKAGYEHIALKREPYQLSGLDDFEEFSKRNKIKRTSFSRYTKESARKKYEINSNGETALQYFDEMIEPDGLYLLDEPENCLSPIFQIELIKLLLEARRFLNCQFIIATHSPLILSIADALIYDLDENPIKNKEWYELENVKAYFEFFYKHKDKFIK